jgi:hypothetical protein
VWDSAAFSSIFLASSFSYSQSESTPTHTQVTQTVGRFLPKYKYEFLLIFWNFMKSSEKSMAVVAIPFLIYPIILFSLCAFFIMHIRISIKKVGVLKTFKSKTPWAILVCIVICGSLHSQFFWGESNPRSGDQLFKDFILNPVPKSVEILDSFDGSPDFYPDECLHFKISPADFQLFLASKSWQTAPEDRLGGFQCGNSDSLWYFTFTPPSFGNNVATYTFVPREKDIEVMFVNSQMNEVYYFYHDGNMP